MMRAVQLFRLFRGGLFGFRFSVVQPLGRSFALLLDPLVVRSLERLMAGSSSLAFDDVSLVYLQQYVQELCLLKEQSKNFNEGEVVDRADYAEIMEKARRRALGLQMKKLLGQKMKVIRV